MGSRTRNQQNRDKRHTTEPEVSASASQAFDDHTDTNLGSPSDLDVVYWDSGTSRYVTGPISGLVTPIAAHGETDGTSTLTAAVNNTWQSVPWDTSIITDVAVCPLTFFAAGGSVFTLPEEGYYHIDINLALAADPDLSVATLEFGLFLNGSGTPERIFYCSSNDWSLNYSEVADLRAANDTYELKFRRSGAGYATVVDISSRGNMAIHKIAQVGYGGATAHALDGHTDTNLGSPADGDIVAWDNGAGDYITIDPNNMDQALDGHTDTNLGSPGAPEDGYVVSWDDATGKYVLAAPTAGAAHALDDHTDTNLGSPGAPEDTYVVAWDNGTSRYVLQPPDTPGPHTFGSHSDVSFTGLAAGDIPQYDGADWVNVPNELNTLADVSLSGLAAGDLFYYDGANWVNYPYASLIAGHNHTLDSLSNVSTAGKAAGDFLWWTGSAWGNRAIRLNDLYDVSTAGATAGQALVFNGTSWAPGTAATSVTSNHVYATAASQAVSGTAAINLTSENAQTSSIASSTNIRAGADGKYQLTVTGYCVATSGTITIAVDVNASGSAYGKTVSFAAGTGGYWSIVVLAGLGSGSYFRVITGGGTGTISDVNACMIKTGN